MFPSETKKSFSLRVLIYKIKVHSFGLSIFVALIVIGLATILKVWLIDDFEIGFVWFTYYPVVMLVAVLGGLIAGLFAIILSCITVLFVLPEFINHSFLNNNLDWLALAAFVLAGVVFSALADALHKANNRANELLIKADRANYEMLAAARVVTEKDRFISKVVDSMPGMIGYWDRNLISRFANNAYLEWFGKTKENILGMRLDDLLGQKLFSLSEPYIKGVWAGKEQKFKRTLTKADGSIGFTWVNYLPDFDEAGVVIGFFVLISDITAITHVETELKLADKILETSLEGIIITNADRIIVSINPSITDITGYSAIELIGRSPDLFKSEIHDENFYDKIWEEINQTGSWKGEILEKHKNGETYPKWMSINVIKDDYGTITHYVGTQTDISERVSYEKEIHRLGFYDPLTQLPNRRLLMDRLQQALSSSNRSKEYGALLFIDLDNFKNINDTLGHLVGDMQLQFVADRLSSCVREGDTVARIGGDEFVVMLVNLSQDSIESYAFTETIASKIVNTLNQPYLLGTKECHTTSSIGIALFGSNNIEIHELFKQADIALYEAKNNGRNTLRFFDPKMQHSINARALLEDDLRNAIELKEFQLHYQLQFDHLNRPIGAEALIRWIHPQRHTISPVNFIPIAEETGLILPIGQWVLETACAQIKQWEQDKFTRHLVLSINVSASQLHENNFVSKLRSVLQRFQINPSLLKLEITESMLLNNIVSTIETMKSIRQFGVQLSLDDFGTGYSSLQYLKQLPLNQLKIDQSFVRDIGDDLSDQAIVRTIIAMAGLLNLDVIAEGVETDAQLEFLKENGCNAFQGYIYNKPMPIDELQKILKNII